MPKKLSLKEAVKAYNKLMDREDSSIVDSDDDVDKEVDKLFKQQKLQGLDSQEPGSDIIDILTGSKVSGRIRIEFLYDEDSDMFWFREL